MRGVYLTLLGACLAMPLLAAEPAQMSAQGLLERLLAAEQKHSFQGAFVYERNGNFSTHAIWHRLEADGQVRERLLQLDGPMQEMLRIDGQPLCVSIAQVGNVVAMPGLHGSPQSAQLMESYELRLLGESRVAGHAAVVVALVPRDAYRYGLELHLDQQTGLTLKSLLLNNKGQLLERFQYTQLDSTSPLSDAALQPSADCLAVPVLPAAAAAASPWHADWLPPGFSLIATQQGPSADGTALTWLMFTDGLARISVFIEPVGDVAVEDLHSQLGPTAVVSRLIPGVEGAVMVTVVGEVPLTAIERVALSMRLSPEQVAP
ncbi:MAG: sigma-E factor negative regulatory protein RseB [Pseudomonas sp.]|jgi:sigma-E factor negative regulatory protein RseB